MLRWLGKIKMRKLFLAARCSLPNSVHRVPIGKHPQKSPDTAQDNPRQYIARIVRPPTYIRVIPIIEATLNNSNTAKGLAWKCRAISVPIKKPG